MRQRPAGAPAGQRVVIGRRLARPALVMGAALMVAGCSGGILQPQGPIGGANALILLDAVVIMSVIVVPTIVAALVFAWWYRASNPRARFRPDFVYSGEIELLVWAVPLLVIMFLGGVIWVGSHELDPFRPIATQEKPLKVQVIALDWKWLFIYPDQGVASVNEVVAPAGTPVNFSITSASVMNQFFVPQLGSMIAAMNGMVTQLHLQADHPGDYHGLSAQYSGDGFAGMNFLFRAVPQDDFTRWVATARQNGPTLDRAAYAQLAQQSQDVKPYTYRAIDPSLFNAVASREIAPAPGPSVENASARVRPKGAH
jgi:cytochrome o ubiquinol oxidase subunit 2